MNLATLVEALGWTLLHSLWQGAALWLALECALALARHASPAVRGQLAGATLTLFVLGVAATFGWSARSESTPRLPPAVAGTAPLSTHSPTSTDDPSTSSAHRPAGAPAAFHPSTVHAPDTSPAADALLPRSTSSSLIAVSSTRAHAWRAFVRPALPWLVALWTLGCVFHLARHGRDWRHLRRLARAPLAPLPPPWVTRFAVLCTRCGLSARRLPRLGESALVRVPLIVGGLAPVILLPAGFLAALSPAQIEAILAHELAHLVRHDFWLNALQCLTEAVFFFHPAVHAINRHLRRERERACDDFAVAHTGDATTYAHALATLAGALPWKSASAVSPSAPSAAPAPVPTLAADGHEPGDLLARLLRLLGRPTPPPPLLRSIHRPGLFLALASVATYAALFALSPAVARALTPAERSAVVQTAVQNATFDPMQSAVALYPQREIRVISRLITEDGSPPPARVVGTIMSRNGPTGRGGSILWKNGLAHHDITAGILAFTLTFDDWAPVALTGFRPPLDATEVEVPPFVLHRGHPLRLCLVGPDGAPLPGINLTVGVRPATLPGDDPLESCLSRPMPTDEHGEFVIPHASSDFVYIISTEAPGWQDARREFREFTPGEPIRWTLEPSRPVQGLVVDAATGAPLATTTVSISVVHGTDARQSQASVGETNTTTDAAGRFTLDRLAAEAAYTLKIDHPSYAITATVVRAGDTPRVALRPGHTISGTLRPIQGGPAHPPSDADPHRLQLAAHVPTVLGSVEYLIGVASTELRPTPTTGTYTFTMERVPAERVLFGAFNLMACADLEVTTDQTGVELLAAPLALVRAGTTAAAALEQSPTPTATRAVELRFYPPDGQPPPEGVTIYACAQTGTGPATRIHTTKHPLTGGVAHVPAAPAPSALRVGFDTGWSGYGFDQVVIDVTTGDAPIVRDIPLWPAGAITGQLLGPDGAPIDADHVTLAPIAPEETLPAWKFDVFGRAGEDGRFALSPVPLGIIYRVVATRGVHACASPPVALTPQQPVARTQLRFAEPGRLTVRIRDPDGPPVPDLAVGFAYRGSREEFRTDAAGEAHLTGLSPDVPGSHLLTAVFPHTWQPLIAEIPATTPSPLTLTRRPGLALHGRVLDPAGRPCAGLRVQAIAPNPTHARLYGQVQLDALAPTDADGRFAFSNLPPGRVTFQIVDHFLDPNLAPTADLPSPSELTLTLP